MKKIYDIRSFIKLLKKNGYFLVRTTGGHFIFKNSEDKTICVNKNLGKMLAQRLIKQYNLIE